jgi:hypothetical protein
MRRNLLAVFIPGDPEDREIIPFGAFEEYGSGPPFAMICFRRTREAATIANVVRTAPIPQEKTRAVFVGSVS